MFDLFVGIDWSGAKGTAHKGISVFCAKQGDAVPQKMHAPDGKAAFSRHDVADLLIALSSQARVLAGIDFAFAYPLDAAGHYFPGLAPEKQPQTAPQLWALIDRLNDAAPDYYGGLIWDDATYGPYYNAPAGRKGARFASRRRQTEEAAKSVKSPSPTFNCVGPAGVGTGSLAGMRLCHSLHHQLGDRLAIWPFTASDKAALTMVEIFPSYYFKQAGISPIKGAQAGADNLNHALAFFNSEPVADDFTAHGPDHDDADALISAAALRAIESEPKCWDVPDCAKREGWIFGVNSAKTPS